ncbi:MAG TPA: NUDIX hydrolase [Dictyoglomaceae bacterium]|nr:NUDIX hydrolase [Dictyoglomaceae bacterium]
MEEKILKEENIYKGRIIEVNEYEVVLPNGKKAKREVVHHPGAVGILPISEDKTIYFVKQYRLPAKSILLEIPAGKLDYGEDPLDCAGRELEEEIGFKSKNLKLIHTFYPSPGISDEILYLFVAKELEKTTLNPDEDEFLEVVPLKKEDLERILFEDGFRDSKTLIAVYYFLFNKEEWLL